MMMKPTSEAELSEMMSGLTQPVLVQGGGTRGVAGQFDVLKTTGLSGVVLYEPGALTLVAKAGTPVAEVEAVLAAENQRLAFEPMDHRGLIGGAGEPTVGGMVAANVSGPRRIQAGACRDFLLGVRFVDGQGAIIRNGGRVMKNVTGYDLVKLMAGSWGALGVLSEVSFKVLPMVEAEATVQVSVAGAADAIRALSAGLGSPYEVSGAAYDPGQGVALLRIEGFEAQVGYRSEQLSNVLARFGAVEVSATGGNSAAIWQRIRDVAPFHGAEGDIWRISVKPTDAPALADRLGADDVLFDWGGGLIWARMPEGADLRARMAGTPGHATLVRASDATMAKLGRFHPEAPGVATLSRALRARFDPKGLLNPGLMDNVVGA